MSVKKRTASKKRSPASVSSVLRDLEIRTPSGAAEKWDNVGLLVGASKTRTLRGAVISIDLTDESIRVAERLGYGLIINHHPCIFPRSKGLARVTAEGSSKAVFAAAQAGLSVISTHTNFDQCAMEVPAFVSNALGFEPVGRLFDGEEGKLTKLVVFVPKTHATKVRDAVCAAGAGKIGRYDHCSFSSEGDGTFRGEASTKPFIGRPGRLESAREVRLETIFPRGLKKPILRALREAHPYEEIAYDLFAVEQPASTLGLVSGLGYGVYGDFAKPVSFETLVSRVRKAFGIRGFLQTEPAPKHVKRIGFVAGKGASFVRSAQDLGCDLFITGEAGYHTAREAVGSGMGVMEIGHRESEIFFLRTMERWCREWGISAKVLNTPVQSVRV